MYVIHLNELVIVIFSWFKEDWTNNRCIMIRIFYLFIVRMTSSFIYLCVLTCNVKYFIHIILYN